MGYLARFSTLLLIPFQICDSAAQLYHSHHPIVFLPPRNQSLQGQRPKFPSRCLKSYPMRFFLYKYHLGKNTFVIFKISCDCYSNTNVCSREMILYRMYICINLKMEKFPNFILISYYCDNRWRESFDFVICFSSVRFKYFVLIGTH